MNDVLWWAEGEEGKWHATTYAHEQILVVNGWFTFVWCQTAE